jgi:cell division inhibitor SepF
MSGAMRRMGEYLGLLEDTGRYDDEYADDYTETYDGYDARSTRERRYAEETGPLAVKQPRQPREHREPRHEVREANVAELAERRRPVGVPTAVATAEPSRIVTLQPSTYNEARTVGENFRDGTPVIMNLTEMDDSDAKRLVDFAAGLVFASRGTIERITNRVFLLSPPDVVVAAEDKARMAEDGFFNQS